MLLQQTTVGYGLFWNPAKTSLCFGTPRGFSVLRSWMLAPDARVLSSRRACRPSSCCASRIEPLVKLAQTGTAAQHFPPACRKKGPKTRFLRPHPCNSFDLDGGDRGTRTRDCGIEGPEKRLARLWITQKLCVSGLA